MNVLCLYRNLLQVSKKDFTALELHSCGIELYKALTSILHKKVSLSKTTSSNLSRRSIVSRMHDSRLTTKGRNIWSI